LKKKFVVDGPVPPRGSRPVAPAKLKQIVGSKPIAAVVKGGIHPVLFAQLRVDFSVEVVEIQNGLRQFRIVEQRQKHVKIGTTTCQHDTRLVFDQGSFHQKSAGQQPHTAARSPTLVVALALPHVQHAAQSTAVNGGHTAFVQLGIAYGIGVENREKSKQMRGVEDRRLVQQDEVLVGIAAAHVKTVGPFAHGRNPGKQANGPNDVCLTQQLRQFFHFLGADLGNRYLCGFQGVDAAFYANSDFVQIHHRGL